MLCGSEIWPVKEVDIIRLEGNNARMVIFRSSCSQMFFKIGFLKTFEIFTGKHTCFPVNIVKFLKTFFL